MGSISYLMRALDISEEEAQQVIEDDKRIDKGEKLFELSKSKNEVARKMKNCARTVDAYGKARTRERKADSDKAFLLSVLTDKLNECAQDIQILNAEREFTFTYNNRKFKVTLSAPRS